ncbi:MarC family protein [Lacihabitans sp. CCS-44]|uniref:MarC family protein n=1 Tax=Lacihabitans sp. CCS-44 TaxID=2487331 RepID=UPI0020CD2FD0|nr:MarC family protein [Lacihabitans sp. CCS-44]MCP9754285.1 MarC family protein [Lacihabitans sp. CCS-44]
MKFNFKEILSVSLILFSIIDILGSIPIILNLRKKLGHINAERITLISGSLMFGYLFLGTKILQLFGVDVKSFAMAGALILLIIGFEMILGREIFKHNTNNEGKGSSIVPLAFPIIAGAGTMTSLISLKAAYQDVNIVVGILVNLVLIFIVLKSSAWLEKKMEPGTVEVLQKVFGLILLAIAIKLIKANIV